MKRVTQPALLWGLGCLLAAPTGWGWGDEPGVSKPTRPPNPAAARSAPTPSRPPRVEEPDVQRLQADPRLQVRMSLDLQGPTVRQVMGRIEVATGVELEAAQDIEVETLSFGILKLVQVPAWKVMRQVTKVTGVDGRWEPAERGYRLVRRSPRPGGSAAVAVTPVPPPEPDGPSPWLIGGVIALGLTIPGLLAYRRFRSRPGVAGA